MPSPFPCSPVIRECSSKKTQIEKKKKKLKRFNSYLNSRHLNVSFTIEHEKDNRMSFLDLNMIREKDKFTTSVYRKLG